MATKSITYWMNHAWASEEAIFFRFLEVMEEFDVPDDYDTLIGVGVSGAIMVPVLARLLGKDFAIVRKDNDGSHGWNKVEGVVGNRWLFVDDLVDSGSTVRRVVHIMSKEFPNSVPFGAYLYHSREFNPADRMDCQTSQ